MVLRAKRCHSTMVFNTHFMETPEVHIEYRKKDNVWRYEITNSETHRIAAGAFVTIKKDSHKGKIGYIQSHESGYGRRLLEAIVDHVQQEGCTILEGEFIPVPETGEHARRLYEQAGFVIDSKSGHMVLDLSKK